MRPLATFHEHAVYLASKPLQFIIGHSSQYFGAVSYLPFNKTYFVNDPLIAKTILTDTTNFSLNHGGGLGFLISEIMGHDQPALFNMEGSAHIKMKSTLLKIFQPKYLEDMVITALQPELDRLSKELTSKGYIDIAKFSHRCTSRLSCHMIGIRATDKDYEQLLNRVTQLSDDLTSMLSITSRLPTMDQKKRGKKIYKKFCDLISSYYSKHKVAKNTVMAMMIDQGLDFEEVKSLLVTLVIAGTETVASAVPRIVAIMIDDQKWHEVTKNQDLLPIAISEGLRITSPAPVIVHGVRNTTAVRDFTFKANSRVLIMLLNILRNDKYFESAMSFNLQRKYPAKYRNFWFGAGPHYCLGAQLAQIEMSFMIKKLLRLGELPTIIKRRYARGSSFPGYSELLVTFDNHE